MTRPTQFSTSFPQGVGIPGGDPALPEGQPAVDCCDDDAEQPDRALDQAVFFGAGGDLTLVQSKVVEGSNTITFDDPPTPGNLMFIAFTVRASVGSVTMPAGWSQAGDPTTTDGNSGQSWLWYKIASVSESDTITISNPTNHRRLAVVEFGGPGVLVDAVQVDSQANAVTYPQGPVDTTADGLVVGLMNNSDAAVVFTDDADFTTIDTGDCDTDFGPTALFSYRAVAAGSWSWTPESNHLDQWCGVVASFDGVDDGWFLAGPEVTDGDDSTYQEISGANVLRIDLGAPFEIARTRIVIGTETAGVRSYVIRAANQADFSDAVLVSTIGFTATGSFTAQTLTDSWVPDDAYQYWELTGNDETRYIYSFELYEASMSGGVTDHGDLTGRDDVDQHPADSVSVVPFGTIAATDVQAALEEIVADAGDFVLKTEGGQDTIEAHGGAGSTETLDPTDGNVHTLTLTADCTITLNAPTGSGAATLEVYALQDGTGGWDITWPGSVVWPGGTDPVPDTTADTLTRYVLETLDGGTTWYGVMVGGGGSIDPDAVKDAGRWELAVVPGSPPDSLYADGDWLYIWVEGV